MAKRRVACRRCGNCSRIRYGVRLTASEARAIRESGKKVPLEFRLSDKAYPARIKVGEDGRCAALVKGKDSKTSCRIYHLCPEICRQYPFRFFGGRVIIEANCAAARDLIAMGKIELSRAEVEKIPMLRSALRAVEKAFHEAKEQKSFEITNH